MATVQVIRKNNNNILGDTLGALGQGMAGLGAGYMGGQQMNMMKDNNENMRKLLERMWGANGAGIQPPMASGAAPAAPGTGPDLSSLMSMLDLSSWR